jgi:DNA-binding CsgD family transcriptional regulator
MRNQPQKGHASTTLKASSVAEAIDAFDCMAYLLDVSQRLHGQDQEIGKRLCQEVALITANQVQLLLHSRETAKNGKISIYPARMIFPVQFNHRVYGGVSYEPSPWSPASPHLSHADVEILAAVCGLILYTLELSALVGEHKQKADARGDRYLSKQEQNVLTLIEREYADVAIMQALNITLATLRKHRQHIYIKLHVHSDRDAILVAYRAGLFSPLEDVAAEN